jgi:hypothetical protein
MASHTRSSRTLSTLVGAVSITLLFLSTPFASCATNVPLPSNYLSLNALTNTSLSIQNQELDLLRVEHYLYINASEDVGMFHIQFSFPPDYEYQVPIMLEVYNDSTTTAILHYQIENDSLPPNKIINFTLAPMNQHDSILLHFSCWVLVKNHDYSDLPSYIQIPKKCQLPPETRTWLVATKEVQLHSLLIRHKAHVLLGHSDNLLRYAKRIAPFLRYNHYVLFVIELHGGLLLSQDALTTLLISGENVGRSHLACAFFRLYHIPARVLLANNDQGFWTQMHYMVEYYCPGYGWVLLDPTKGETPYATKHQVINRVCYPQDENDTKRDYLFRFMTGEERWFWIDTTAVSPWYADLKKGSKSQMFTEATVSVDELSANYAFVLTQLVFRPYQLYLGMNLTGANLLHFQNATSYQQKAITAMQGQDVPNYITFLNQASAEYNQIIP